MLKFNHIKIQILPLLITCYCAVSCADSAQLTEEQIIDKCYTAAGSHLAENATIKFDFRDRSYEVTRNHGLFEMTRYTYISEDSVWMDRYHNYGFQRFLNDSMVSISDSAAKKYQAAINSVIYFFSLPMGLKDAAVNASLLEETKIDGADYYKLKIWFDETGGGEDHDDVYIYWVNKQDFSADYLAYSFKTEGGGMRFRKAINPRILSGIRVVDYLNYAPTEPNINIEQLDKAYMKDSLTLISEIENDNVSISLIKE